MTRKKKIIVITTVSVVVALALAVGVYFYIQSKKQEEEPKIELDSEFETEPRLPDAVTGEPNGIRIAGYPEVTVPAGEKDVVLNLMNPEGNPCYFTFTITLKDTDEVIYASKAVEPGGYIGTATLNRALEAGEYEANIHIGTTSVEDGTPMNDANLDTKIIAR